MSRPRAPSTPAAPAIATTIAPPSPAPSSAQPPPAPSKITAPPTSWIDFAPGDHAFTAKFERAPVLKGGDNDRRYTVSGDFSIYSVHVVDATAAQSESKSATMVADDFASIPSGRTTYRQVRTLPSANATWEVRDVWYRVNVLGDGVPWYARKRVAVTTTAPFRVVTATAIVGLPDQIELADAFVENVIAAERPR